MAESEEEAVRKYKERRKWNNFKRVIDPWWGCLSSYPCLNKKNPDYKYEVIAQASHANLNFLKDEMWADEFLEYCRQKMYPIEIVLSETK